MQSNRPRPFRFAIQTGPFDDPVALREFARKVEGLGYAELFSSDHLDSVDPFLPLMVAAEATTTLRFGPLVINNEFHNPAMLARSAATFDRLSQGRLVLGMGTGYMQWEHDPSDIELRGRGPRVTRFEESIDAIRALLDTGATHVNGEHIRLAIDDIGIRPAQAHVPILIGGHGRRVVTIAAAKADIFQFTGLTHDPGSGKPSGGGFAPNAVASRHEWLRDAAGARYDQIELSALVQVTKVGAGAAEVRARASERIQLSSDDLDETPFVLIGSVAEVCEKLHRLRERFGIHHIVIRDPDDFAPVVAALASR